MKLGLTYSRTLGALSSSFWIASTRPGKESLGNSLLVMLRAYANMFSILTPKK